MGTQMLGGERLNLPFSRLSVDVSALARHGLIRAEGRKGCVFDSLGLRTWGQQVPWARLHVGGEWAQVIPGNHLLQARMPMGQACDWHTENVQSRLVKKSSCRGTSVTQSVKLLT